MVMHAETLVVHYLQRLGSAVRFLGEFCEAWGTRMAQDRSDFKETKAALPGWNAG